MTNDPASEYDWARLVSSSIHPIKVAIIEAMVYLREPLSASDFQEIFEGEHPLPNIAYHLGNLRKECVVVKVREVQKRGAIEKFYMLSGSENRSDSESA